MKEIIALTEGWPNWAYALAVAAAIYGLTKKFCEHLREDVDVALSHYLQGDYAETWAQQFGALFDYFFGPDPFSRRRFLRSAAASILMVVVLYTVLEGILGLIRVRASDTMPVWQVLAIGAVINIIPDWLSLWQTRWLLRMFEKVRSIWAQFLVLIVDAIVTGILIYAAIQGFRWATGQPPLAIVEIAALFSIYAVFFYSTFLTSLLAWLFWITSGLSKLFNRLHLNDLLEAQKKPGPTLALYLGLLTFLGVLSVKPLITLPEDGHTTVDSLLCTHFPASACTHAARLTTDEEAKLAFLTKACDGGVTAECVAAGLERLENRPTEAASLWQKGCEAGNALACTSLGVLYHQEIGVALDLAKAGQFYRRGCTGGDAGGCSNLATLYVSDKGLERDHSKARAFFQLACDGGNASGCGNLGRIYDRGMGVDRDMEKARQLYEISCTSGHAAGCVSLGILFERGDGVPQNPQEAGRLYQTGCAAGSADGCGNLGLLYAKGVGHEQNFETARQFFEKGCDGGSANACSNLGKIYKDGLGVESDPSLAQQFFARGCDAGDPKGCSHLGLLYDTGSGVPKDPEKARTLLQKGCDGGDAEGCTNLGVILTTTTDGAADYETGQELFRVGCDGGDAAGCGFLGWLHGNALGVSLNPQLAEDFYRQGCGMGHEWSCAQLTDPESLPE